MVNLCANIWMKHSQWQDSPVPHGLPSTISLSLEVLRSTTLPQVVHRTHELYTRDKGKTQTERGRTLMAELHCWHVSFISHKSIQAIKLTSVDRRCNAAIFSVMSVCCCAAVSRMACGPTKKRGWNHWWNVSTFASPSTKSINNYHLTSRAPISNQQQKSQ